MRVLAVGVLSFVLALIVGMFVLPGRAPTHKPNPRPPKLQAPQAPKLETLPALPSLQAARIDVPSSQYEDASRLLKARRYREAEDAYLQILMRRPDDRKAIDGLAAARRLQANQNSQQLQKDAARYRRAIVEGRVTEENYTPREMELLAEASLAAANTITSEERAKAVPPSPIPVSVPVTSVTAPRRGSATGSLPAAAGQRIARVALGGGAHQSSRPAVVTVATVRAAAPPSGAARPPEAASLPAPPLVAPQDTKTSAPPSASPTVRAPDPPARPAPSSAPPSTPEVTPARPLGSIVPEPYVLSPGDQLEVNVPHLAVTVTIDPDGVITLPMISPVKAAGKTTAQLASDLTSMYSRVLQAPSLTVFVRRRLNP